MMCVLLPARRVAGAGAVAFQSTLVGPHPHSRRCGARRLAILAPAAGASRWHEESMSPVYISVPVKNPLWNGESGHPLLHHRSVFTL